MKEKIIEILTQASETHHSVYAKENGNDPDWATWYANWLVEHSPLGDILKTKPVRSELTYLLVLADKEYAKDRPEGSWQEYYADRIIERFG